LLEYRRVVEEALSVIFATKSHDPFNAGAVVPRPIEQDEFSRGRQMLDIPLKIPLGLVALGRRRKSDNAGFARAQMLDDMLDDAVLTGRVSPLDKDNDAIAMCDQLPLEFDQLDLEITQSAAILMFVPIRARYARIDLDRRLLHGDGVSGSVLFTGGY
jgi:hypothetical protein